MTICMWINIKCNIFKGLSFLFHENSKWVHWLGYIKRRDTELQLFSRCTSHIHLSVFSVTGSVHILDTSFPQSSACESRPCTLYRERQCQHRMAFVCFMKTDTNETIWNSFKLKFLLLFILCLCYKTLLLPTSHCNIHPIWIGFKPALNSHLMSLLPTCPHFTVPVLHPACHQHLSELTRTPPTYVSLKGKDDVVFSAELADKTSGQTKLCERQMERCHSTVIKSLVSI